MATKKKVENKEVVNEPLKFYGRLLLRLPRYNNREARLLLKPNELYSYEDADKLISNFMKKKG